MRNLLRKIHFGHISRKFSLNRPIIRLKFAQNLPQTGFPSRRLSFLDGLLGGCPRMRNLLRKIHFGQFLSKFSLNRLTIRFKFEQNLPQTGFPSQRLSFSDSLLAN
ncbi:hypothetical protein MNBD_GAMMA07-2567 [hydrothermal vent metagenome]|uniref:Uncharacterized protein n=1 Tax=hydrothermal vent metagenome TaxID=652676 RepID=A0A3B0WL61_9ZZZZ